MALPMSRFEKLVGDNHGELSVLMTDEREIDILVEAQDVKELGELLGLKVEPMPWDERVRLAIGKIIAAGHAMKLGQYHVRVLMQNDEPVTYFVFGDINIRFNRQGWQVESDPGEWTTVIL